MASKLIVHTAQTGAQGAGGEKKRKATLGERLIRNTAIACALLLAVSALMRLDTPFGREATEKIRAAVTMRVDLSDALGRLSFVRALFPETALVFWNLGADDLYLRPAAGEVAHAFSQSEPYVEFSCAAGSPVYAAASGDVTAVSRGAGGDYLVCLTHSDGRESWYAYLKETGLRVGDTVNAGDTIGTAGENGLHFELREAGQAADPGDLRPVAS